LQRASKIGGWATTPVFAGPATSRAQTIGAVTYARVRACGPGGCSVWQDFVVPFPFPAWLPPPVC
jgi:hypothetical protein